MATVLANLLRPLLAPVFAVKASSVHVTKIYQYWRFRIFYSMYIGYVFFYFTRKSFSCAMPEIASNLNLNNEKLGLISTSLYITYGISKFASGVLSDRSNPRYFMSIGLILTGVFSIFFGFSSSLWWLVIFWGLNGYFQGWGWPPITKQLTYWYAKKERGFWWSLCSTSHNVGGGLIPIIVSVALSYPLGSVTNWRYAIILPGAFCIMVGIFLLNRLRDIPQSMGLPPVETLHDEDKETKNISANMVNDLTPKQILFEYVLNNPFLWLLSFTYFFVYIIRFAINDWSIHYLVKSLHYSHDIASIGIMWFEVGGLIGTLVAGWCSDVVFKGRRVPFMLLSTIGVMVGLLGLMYLPAGAKYIYSCYSLMAVIGFFIFGPQMLVGLAAAEFVDQKAACTATGFVGCWGYLGAAVTGMPLGKLIDISWQYYYYSLIACAVAIVVILLSLGKR